MKTSAEWYDPGEWDNDDGPWFYPWDGGVVVNGKWMNPTLRCDCPDCLMEPNWITEVLGAMSVEVSE